MFNPSRDEARRFFIEAWKKRRDGTPGSPMEAVVADVIEAHPEYHPLYELGEDGLTKEWTPEAGETNPFLHINLHVAVREQVSVDQPQGIRALHMALASRLGDLFEADHRVMDCLAEQIWQNQRNGVAFSNDLYLDCVRKQLKNG
jgi:hypothetical protein